MRPVLVLVGLALTTPAHAGKRKKPDPEPAVEAAPDPVVQEPLTGLFPGVIAGWDIGGLPPGLPSLAATACGACHYRAHDDWVASPHAGPGSDAWRAAAEEAGTPACLACHEPLIVQRPELFTFDAGDVQAPVSGPNQSFDAGLFLEGVSCAVCHVRGGHVVGTRPITEPPPAHPGMQWSKEVGSPESCAACHQLTWPGADRPLYDTWGEWSRSGYAEAGVDCAACHLGAGAEEGPVRHQVGADLARAVTIDLQLPGLALTRGGDALEATVTLTNTGAGHAVPTGSPWRAIQVEVLLERPPQGKEKAPVEVARVDTMLQRTLSEAPPWTTTDDTRLGVGERRAIAWTGALNDDAKASDWAFVVRLREVVRGVPAGQPTVERRVPLRVD